ncbi:MAG: carboxypeptidase regulatory-like domain-containing protein [Verrucomicrobiota bacterium]
MRASNPFPGFGALQVHYNLGPGFTISGFVSNNVMGLMDVDLDLFQVLPSGDVIRVPDTVLVTDSNGMYQTRPLPPGDYIVRADPGVVTCFINQYYTFNGDPALFPTDGDVLTISNRSLSDINIVVEKGMKISGTITDTNGMVLAGIDIDLFDVQGRFMEVNATTDSNGTYVIGAVPAGDYIVQCEPTPDQGYIGLYYSNSFLEAGAVPVPVIADQDTTNINFVLKPGASIRGRITDTNGVPLYDVDLDVFDTAGNRLDPDGDTDLDGYYAIGPLPPGTSYVVRADPDPETGYMRTYYTNNLFVEQATPVALPDLMDVTNINFALQAGQLIEGTVRDTNGIPIANIDIDVYGTNGMRMDVDTSSDAIGNYRIGPFLPGSFIVRADPDAGQGWVRQYYTNALLMNMPRRFRCLTTYPPRVSTLN